MLSWRYLGHPQGGGAEVMAHELMRRLVARGHEVTCFTACYPGSATTAELDGVRIVRAGRQWTVHVQAHRWLRRRLEDFDRVVDQVNTIPFLTPAYVPRAKRRLLIFQLARQYWFWQTHGPAKAIAPIGYAAEPLYLRTYRTTKTITISQSTRDDLVALGFDAAQIAIVQPALTAPVVAALEPKQAGPLRIVMLGRLSPAKRFEDGLRATALVRRAVPDLRLDVIGDGPPHYRERLVRLAGRLGVADVVTFHGRVGEERKHELLAGAHVHLFTSHREGWGLVVSEAAAVGTLSVGYDAPGVRDSIADARLLARPFEPASLAERIVALQRDGELCEGLRREAWVRARELSYDRAADDFERALA
jgi:glycosyltransferase involved in cell wall biosynthesis